MEKDIVGEDDWWNTTDKEYNKLKFSRHPKFRLLNTLFNGCIEASLCKCIVSLAPPAHFNTKMYMGFLMDDDTELRNPSKTVSHPHRSTTNSTSRRRQSPTTIGATSSREAELACTIARCMVVQQNNDSFFEWEVTYALSTKESNCRAIHVLLDKSAELTQLLFHSVGNL